jgi:hypothetical protein
MDSFTVTAGSSTGRRTLLAAVVLGIVFALIAFFCRHYGASLQQDAFGYAHELPLLAAGLHLFFFGFREIRKKRLIEHTPTAKIRSVALGCVEVTGTAQQRSPLKTPLTAADCVVYRFKVEQQTRDSKGRTHWRTVRQGNSTSYFYVQDETGKILVDPLGAEVLLTKDYVTVDKAGLGPAMRYSEWYIQPGDFVYILGTAKKFTDAAASRAARLAEKLRQIKADQAALLKEFDADQDGHISIEEWDRARAAAEDAVLAEELRQPQSAADDLVIGTGEHEKTFIISDHDEKEVAGRIFGRSAFSSIGGFALSAAMFAALLARAGILNKAYAISWHMLYR